jgi:uncharacterized protein YceK
MRYLMCVLACVILNGCAGIVVNFNANDGAAGEFCKNVALDRNERRDVPVWKEREELNE